MKKSLLLAIPALFTCGCSTSGAGGASGKIDCYYIGVNVGNTSVFSKTYSQSSVRVFEYKDTSGNKLYFNTRIQYEKNVLGTYLLADSELRVYKTRYATQYVSYTYSSFVGWLLFENNYYLDLSSKTIDSEEKYSEYLYGKNPTNETADNKAAIAAAKTGYYVLSSGYASEHVELYLDVFETGLERHAYIQLGSDTIVTYKEKFFK